MTRCIDCRYLAGSDRTPQWLFARSQGYCDHPDREGGPWNCLLDITKATTCRRFDPAPAEKIAQREKALSVLRQRFKDARPAPLTRLPARGRGRR